MASGEGLSKAKRPELVAAKVTHAAETLAAKEAALRSGEDLRRYPAIQAPRRLFSSNGASDGPTPTRPDGGLSHTEPDELFEPTPVEFISIPEWSRRLGCSRESGYRAARRGEIPGLFRIGRLKRVNWTLFLKAAVPSSAAEHRAPREH
jgi:predicted DNA-binding transcriptional regulator AlpA